MILLLPFFAVKLGAILLVATTSKLVADHVTQDRGDLDGGVAVELEQFTNPYVKKQLNGDDKEGAYDFSYTNRDYQKPLNGVPTTRRASTRALTRV